MRDELEQLLDDDDDMADLYLSRKLSYSSSPSHDSADLTWSPPSPTIESKISRASRTTPFSTHGENDVEELEMLLEVHFSPNFKCILLFFVLKKTCVYCVSCIDFVLFF